MYSGSLSHAASDELRIVLGLTRSREPAGRLKAPLHCAPGCSSHQTSPSENPGSGKPTRGELIPGYGPLSSVDILAELAQTSDKRERRWSIVPTPEVVSELHKTAAQQQTSDIDWTIFCTVSRGGRSLGASLMIVSCTELDWQNGQVSTVPCVWTERWDRGLLDTWRGRTSYIKTSPRTPKPGGESLYDL